MNGRWPSHDELQEYVSELAARNAEFERQVAPLTAQVESLLKRLEVKARAGQRPAAPFSKGPPQPHPKPPGRNSGDDDG